MSVSSIALSFEVELGVHPQLTLELSDELMLRLFLV